ncbi:MAG: type II toxin-antitoxin system PemK/MazF family toxin [Cyanobacteria bacterium P01_A01_bin.116]
MPLAKGDIILVPFPFTDLSQTKLRPAVVLWADSKGQDVTLCFISSQNIDRLTANEFEIAATDPQFSMTGLKVTSKVRVTRVVTLERRLLQRRLGRLGDRLMPRLDQVLRNAFQLGSAPETMAGGD